MDYLAQLDDPLPAVLAREERLKTLLHDQVDRLERMSAVVDLIRAELLAGIVPRDPSED